MLSSQLQGHDPGEDEGDAADPDRDASEAAGHGGTLANGPGASGRPHCEDRIHANRQALALVDAVGA